MKKLLVLILIVTTLALAGLAMAADWTGPNDAGDFFHLNSGRQAKGIYLQPCTDFKTTKLDPSLTPAAVTLATGEQTFYDDITLVNNGSASDLRYRKVPNQGDSLPADWATNFSRIKQNAAPFTFRATGYEKIFFWTSAAETDASSIEECWPGSLGAELASTYTATKTSTPTATKTVTLTSTPTATPSITASFSQSPSFTASGTKTSTPTATKTATGTATPSASPTISPTPSNTPVIAALKIVEVYAGGGSSGAVYENDFAVIFNTGLATASLTGMSLQKGTTGSSFVSKVNLSGSILANSYYLVKMASSGAIGSALPTEDLDGTVISLANGTGTLALVNSTSLVSCGAGTVVDVVGWGATAGCFETQSTSSIAGNGVSLQRDNDCLDTGDNAADWNSFSPPQPRNASSSTHTCP